MRRLFWKIFGWFWGSMILIGLALYFVVLTTRPDPMPSAWRDAASTTLAVTAASAISDWEKSGAESLAATLRESGHQATSRFWLFDENGVELSGMPLPPAAGEERRPPFMPPDDQGPEDRPAPLDGQMPPNDRIPSNGQMPPNAPPR